MRKGKLGPWLLAASAALALPCLVLTRASAAGALNGMVTSLFGENAGTLDILLLLTILTLLPSILIMLTGFTRIIIVLSFMRNAIGMQQTPPNQVLVSLALFLTIFVMMPTFQASYDQGIRPLVAEEIDALGP